MPRLPLYALAALVTGALAGTVAGHATVIGIKPDAVVTQRVAGAYGVPVARDAFAPYDGEVEPVAYPGSEPDAAAPAEAVRYETGCADCSDYELGYRWADDQQLRRASACATDSWSFQRGCEAALRDRGYEAI